MRELSTIKLSCILRVIALSVLLSVLFVCTYADTEFEAVLSKDEFFEPSSTGVVISITNDTASEIVLLSLELPPKRRIEINETLSAGRTRSFDTSIESSYKDRVHVR